MLNYIIIDTYNQNGSDIKCIDATKKKSFQKVLYFLSTDNITKWYLGKDDNNKTRLP